MREVSRNVAAKMGAIAWVLSACSGSAGGSGGTTGVGGEAAAGGGNTTATGGFGNTSGATQGGTTSSGVSSGGAKPTGGTLSVGGTATGGRATGGALSVGGSSTGGKSSVSTGGRSTGGSASGGSASGGNSSSAAKVLLPTANASFDYQIGGAYAPPSGVQVVSRDRNSAPAAGLYNICYVNGFQIQPDEESFWTGQHPSLILRDSAGKPVVDVDWGEMLLDTSTAAKRAELATLVGAWIAKCKTDGFNAVEVDNLDSYSRSNGLLTQANNVAFMTSLSAAAHQNGLAIAQKNSSELLGSVKSMGTDFAVVEECNRYSECDTYQSAYGNLVFIIEYRAQDFQKGCSAYPELSIVLRDLNVTTPSSASYVYQGC